MKRFTHWRKPLNPNPTMFRLLISIVLFIALLTFINGGLSYREATAKGEVVHSIKLSFSNGVDVLTRTDTVKYQQPFK